MKLLGPRCLLSRFSCLSEIYSKIHPSFDVFYSVYLYIVNMLSISCKSLNPNFIPTEHLHFSFFLVYRVFLLFFFLLFWSLKNIARKSGYSQHCRFD